MMLRCHSMNLHPRLPIPYFEEVDVTHRTHWQHQSHPYQRSSQVFLMADGPASRPQCLNKRPVTQMPVPHYDEHSRFFAQKFQINPNSGYRYPYPPGRSFRAYHPWDGFTNHDWSNITRHASSTVRPQNDNHNNTLETANPGSLQRLENQFIRYYGEPPFNPSYKSSSPASFLPANSTNNNNARHPNRMVSQPKTKAAKSGAVPTGNPRTQGNLEVPNARDPAEDRTILPRQPPPNNPNYNPPPSSGSANMSAPNTTGAPNRTAKQPTTDAMASLVPIKQCTHCNLKFINSQDLVRHNMEAAQSFECKYCSRRFVLVTEFLDHVQQEYERYSAA